MYKMDRYKVRIESGCFICELNCRSFKRDRETKDEAGDDIKV